MPASAALSGNENCLLFGKFLKNKDLVNLFGTFSFCYFNKFFVFITSNLACKVKLGC